MEEKYQLKEGCLTIQMPKELDHHEAGRLKMEADFLIGAYPFASNSCLIFFLARSSRLVTVPLLIFS